MEGLEVVIGENVAHTEEVGYIYDHVAKSRMYYP